MGIPFERSEEFSSESQKGNRERRRSVALPH
jgi:hypothetical protein